MPARLLGHIAIVSLDPYDTEALARGLARQGAGVVVVSADAERGGRLAAAIHAEAEARVAVFCPVDALENELDALVELVRELNSGGRP